MSCIHYKFRSSLEYDTVTFDGVSISLADLKKAIMAQKKFGKNTDFDLEITNAQTKEAYKDEVGQIPKNSSVIIKRVPTGTRSKAQMAADKKVDPFAGGLPKTRSDLQDLQDTSRISKMVDLVNSNASEEDKLKVMMSQAGEDWQPTNYVRGRGRGYYRGGMSGAVPSHYVCFRCGQPGHYIRNCPKNGVKPNIGIPKAFFGDTGSGNASPNQDEGKKAKTMVPVNTDAPAVTKMERKVPSELKCPTCKKLLTDAVLIPCCGTSYCDECIRSYLLENEQECPTCGAEDVSPDSLIINKQLRQAVNNVRYARPASPFVNNVDSPSSTSQAAETKPQPDVKVAETTDEETTKPSESEKVVKENSSKTVENEAEAKKREVNEKEPSTKPEKEEVCSPLSEPAAETTSQSTPHHSPHRDEPGSPSREPHRDGPGSPPRGPPFGHPDMHQRHPGPHPGLSELPRPHSVPPEGVLHVPPMRPAHSLPPQVLIRPTFVPVPLPVHPMPTMVAPHPLLMVPGPFGVGAPRFPHDDGPPPMSEEEFYRYQRKMKSKHKKKEPLRSKEREKVSAKAPQKAPQKELPRKKEEPTNFDDELSEYRALQRSRQPNPSRITQRSRSRSPLRSRSWSRSRSPLSGSHSSRSPTPEDWDRSRTPSRSPSPGSRSKSQTSNEDKKRKHKKRKKHHKHKHSKKRKTDEGEAGVKNGDDKSKKKKSNGEKLEKKKSSSDEKLEKEKANAVKKSDKKNSNADEKTEKKKSKKKSKDKLGEKRKGSKNKSETKKRKLKKKDAGSEDKLEETVKDNVKEDITDKNDKNTDNAVKADTIGSKPEPKNNQIEFPETEISENLPNNEQNDKEVSSTENVTAKKHKRRKHKKKHKHHKNREKNKETGENTEENEGTVESREGSETEPDKQDDKLVKQESKQVVKS